MKSMVFFGHLYSKLSIERCRGQEKGHEGYHRPREARQGCHGLQKGQKGLYGHVTVQRDSKLSIESCRGQEKGHKACHGPREARQVCHGLQKVREASAPAAVWQSREIQNCQSNAAKAKKKAATDLKKPPKAATDLVFWPEIVGLPIAFFSLIRNADAVYLRERFYTYILHKSHIFQNNKAINTEIQSKYKEQLDNKQLGVNPIPTRWGRNQPSHCITRDQVG